MKRFRLPVNVVLLATAVLLAGGCCGVGAGPSAGEIRQSLTRCVGGPARSAADLLRARGFSINEDSEGKSFSAHKTTDICVFVEDGLFVSVTSDENGRVASFHVEPIRIMP